MINRAQFIILFLLLSLKATAQQAISDPGLARLISRHQQQQKQLPTEKLYVQTDRAVYAPNDTIWLKGYLFDADYLKYSSRSGLIYIELQSDSSNEVVYRRMLPVGYGIATGQIALNKRDMPPGNYTLRAYTNWQRNFGEDDIFTKRIYIIPAGRQSWQVQENNKGVAAAGNETIQTNLLLLEAGKPLRLHDLQLRVREGNKTILRGDAVTDVNGLLAVNYSVKSNSNNNLNLLAADKKDGYKQTIPIILNRPENTDVQFMPEGGGSLIAGITTKTGFKAIGEDGRGTNVSGTIVNGKGEIVAKFASLHKGMGSFSFTPKAGESYIAKINLPNNTTKTYSLPQVKSTGTVMNVSLTADSIKLRLTAVTDNNNSNSPYFLIAQSRGVICYAEPVSIANNNTKIITVAQNLFPTGIARFSLLNKDGIPMNERIVYIDHNDNLNISITPNKTSYSKRDSIALNIEVKDKEGKPVQGSFSLAVTDDKQNVTDTTQSNLTTSLLLTSDLKGTVEEPNYYLDHTTANQAEREQALDNLLLTQGWVSYEPATSATTTTSLTYPAEPEFTIKGRVTNMLNKGAANARVMLYGKNQPTLFADADTAGRFTFTQLPITDTASYFIKATSSKGKALGMGIDVDAQYQPAWQRDTAQYRRLPWQVTTTDTIKKPIIPAYNQLQEEEPQTIAGNHVLKQVEIREKKIIKGSKSLNQPGENDQTLDEKDIEKSGAKTLLDLLEQKVKGFYTGTLFTTTHPPVPIRTAFLFPGNRNVYIVIDGKIILDWDYRIVKSYLENCPASDVIGIEVNISDVNMQNYLARYFPYAYKITDPPPIPKAFIEVTTRSGVGPFRQVTAGTLAYKPLYQFNIAKQFYRPRYLVKTPDGLDDNRATLHWDPLVITDEHGKATVSFYASDHPEKYNVTVEGSNMNGKIGSTIKQIGN